MKQKLGIVKFALLLLLYSCGTEYMTVTPNMPFFKDKGEVQSEFSISNIYVGKLAFSPVNHIGVFLNGQLNPGGTDETNHHLLYHSCIETAVGGYGKQKSFYYEGYIGYGVAKTDYKSSLDPMHHIYYHYSKIFSQINFAYISEKNNQFGICLKYIWVDYKYDQQKHFGLIEPSIYFSPKIFDCMNASFYISRFYFSTDSYYPNTSHTTLSLGLKFFINRK